MLPKPLPKWVGFLGLAVTALASGWTVYQTNGDVPASIAAVVGACIAWLSHSATGTGGVPTK